MLWREHGNPECGVQVTRCDPQFDTAPHEHLFWEIALIDRGEAQHQTSGGTRTVRQGQVMLIRPQVWHGYLQCRNMAVINCLISTQALHRILPLLESVPGADELLRRRGRSLACEEPLVLTPGRWTLTRLRETFRAMLLEQQHKEPAWQAANLGQLLQVLSLVIRAVNSRPAQLPARTSQGVRKAASLIEADCTRDFPLSELARLVDLSPAHLSRSFKRQMGMGVVDYGHHLRIEEACRLLRLTDWPITRIAGQVGYSEIAYFSRCFKNRLGRSPQAYRQQTHL